MATFNQQTGTFINRFGARPLSYARRTVIIPILATALVACGGDDSPTPTATPPVPTATTVSTATVNTTTATQTSTAPASPAASPAAGTTTVGDLADRIAAAWPRVSSYRTTTTVSSTNGQGTPTSVPAVVTVAEVQLPDRKHWLSQANGVTQYEFIAIGGRLFGRGPALAGQSGSAQQGSWFEIDPTTVDSESVFSTLYAQLLAPVTAPYVSLGPQERSRDALPIEPRVIDGQTCSAYRLADTTETGERIEIIISLGSNDLPCAIETRVGGQETVTTYTYNVELEITTPIAASPEAGTS